MGLFSSFPVLCHSDYQDSPMASSEEDSVLNVEESAVRYTGPFPLHTSVQYIDYSYCLECGCCIGRGSSHQLCGLTYCYHSDHTEDPTDETSEAYQLRVRQTDIRCSHERYRRTDRTPSWLTTPNHVECWNKVRFYQRPFYIDIWYCSCCEGEQEYLANGGQPFDYHKSTEPRLCENRRCRYSYFTPPDDLNDEIF